VSREEKKGTRREFFRSLGRYITLGAIGAGGGVVASRRGIDPGSHRCINKSVCCSCGVYDGCRLPAALSAKERREQESSYRKDEKDVKG